MFTSKYLLTTLLIAVACSSARGDETKCLKAPISAAFQANDSNVIGVFFDKYFSLVDISDLRNPSILPGYPQPIYGKSWSAWFDKELDEDIELATSEGDRVTLVTKSMAYPFDWNFGMKHSVLAAPFKQIWSGVKPKAALTIKEGSETDNIVWVEEDMDLESLQTPGACLFHTTTVDITSFNISTGSDGTLVRTKRVDTTNNTNQLQVDGDDELANNNELSIGNNTIEMEFKYESMDSDVTGGNSTALVNGTESKEGEKSQFFRVTLVQLGSKSVETKQVLGAQIPDAAAGAFKTFAGHRYFQGYLFKNKLAHPFIYMKTNIGCERVEVFDASQAIPVERFTGCIPVPVAATIPATRPGIGGGFWLLIILVIAMVALVCYAVLNRPSVNDWSPRVPTFRKNVFHRF